VNDDIGVLCVEAVAEIDGDSAAERGRRVELCREDVVPCLDRLPRDLRAEVAGAAGDEDLQRSASIDAVSTIPLTRRASFAFIVMNASACSCVSAMYSAS